MEYRHYDDSDAAEQRRAHVVPHTPNDLELCGPDRAAESLPDPDTSSVVESAAISELATVLERVAVLAGESAEVLVSRLSDNELACLYFVCAEKYLPVPVVER